MFIMFTMFTIHPFATYETGCLHSRWPLKIFMIFKLSWGEIELRLRLICVWGWDWIEVELRLSLSWSRVKVKLSLVNLELRGKRFFRVWLQFKKNFEATHIEKKNIFYVPFHFTLILNMFWSLPSILTFNFHLFFELLIFFFCCSNSDWGDDQMGELTNRLS